MEMSMLRAAAHHQQHETGAGFGTGAWLGLSRVRETQTFNKYPAARLKVCTYFKLGLQTDPRFHVLDLWFAIICVRNSSQGEAG